MSNDVKKALVPKLRFPKFREAEAWEKAQLGQVLLAISSGLSIEQINDPSGFKVTRIETISDQTIDLNKVGFIKTELDISSAKLNVGDILLSNINSISHIGKSVIIDQDYNLYHGMNLLRLVVDPNAHNSNFIFFLLNTAPVRASIKARANKAVNQASINQTELGRTAAIIPKLNEQQKIADCLSSIDEIISAQSQKLDTLKTHKKGLMQQLFPGEGETIPRLRFPEFRDTGEWVPRNFFDLLDDILDFRGRTPLKLGMNWGDGGIVSLSANNVKNGYIDFGAECNLGSDALYEKWMGKVSLDEGDIVFTMEAPLGKALLVPDSQRYILSQRVVAFKTKKDVVNKFLIQLIWSEKFQSELEKLSTGSTAKGINQKTLKKIDVMLPKEKKEQQEIADCLFSIDELISAHNQKLDTLKTHKKGLMQQLFPAADEVET